MRAKEIRTMAWESLSGKWGKSAIITAIYVVVSFLIGMILAVIPVIGQIISIIISPVLSFGILVSFMKLSRNEDATYFGFLKDGFDLFGKVWGVTLQTLLRVLPAIILFAISGSMQIISVFSRNAGGSASFGLLAVLLNGAALIWLVLKTYSLALALFILNDEPTLKSSEIVKKSEALMKGNKWRLFCLELSFIGWIILVSITFGLALLWIFPYMQIATVKFYEEIAGTQTNLDDDLS